MTPLMKVEESFTKPSWTPLAVWQTSGLICLILCAKLCKSSIVDVDVTVTTETNADSEPSTVVWLGLVISVCLPIYITKGF
jgi:hypothetical protein